MKMAISILGVFVGLILLFIFFFFLTWFLFIYLSLLLILALFFCYCWAYKILTGNTVMLVSDYKFSKKNSFFFFLMHLRLAVFLAALHGMVLFVDRLLMRTYLSCIPALNAGLGHFFLVPARTWQMKFMFTSLSKQP